MLLIKDFHSITESGTECYSLFTSCTSNAYYTPRSYSLNTLYTIRSLGIDISYSNTGLLLTLQSMPLPF